MYESYINKIEDVGKLRNLKPGTIRTYKNNVRDFATMNELTVLSNLETHNAQMIREGREKKERFAILKEIAEYQLGILNAAEQIKIEERAFSGKPNIEM